MLDVAIVGGGPAGLHTGALLARAGFAVTVFEEHPAVGQPAHCTGVLADDAFNEFALPRSCALNVLSTARFVSPSGTQLAYTTPRTEAVVIDRPALDRAMAEEAMNAGVRIRVGQRVRQLDPQPGHMRLTLDGGEIVESRAAVLACGASYSLQRRLGMGLPAVALNSAQVEAPAGRTGDVELHFGNEIAPGGFAWTVPVSRPTGLFVRIGLMSEGDAVAFFDRFLSRVARSWGVPAEAVTAPRRRYLPLAALNRTFAERLLVVGDAAGMVKPTTGGGIYYSLVSARLAAETLVPALTDDRLDAGTLGQYQRRWRERFTPEFRAQLALRMLAQRLTDAEIDSFFDLARTNGIMPLVRRTATFNQHRHLIAELFRYAPARELLFRRLMTV